MSGARLERSSFIRYPFLRVFFFFSLPLLHLWRAGVGVVVMGRLREHGCTRGTRRVKEPISISCIIDVYYSFGTIGPFLERRASQWLRTWLIGFERCFVEAGASPTFAHKAPGCQGCVPLVVWGGHEKHGDTFAADGLGGQPSTCGWAAWRRRAAAVWYIHMYMHTYIHICTQYDCGSAGPPGPARGSSLYINNTQDVQTR